MAHGGEARPTLSAQRIFAAGAGYHSSAILAKALRLGVFRILADSPGTADAMARRMRLPAVNAMDLLDALVALRLLDRQDGEYANTAESACYLDPASPAYVGEMLRSAKAA